MSSLPLYLIDWVIACSQPDNVQWGPIHLWAMWELRWKYPTVHMLHLAFDAGKGPISMLGSPPPPAKTKTKKQKTMFPTFDWQAAYNLEKSTKSLVMEDHSHALLVWHLGYAEKPQRQSLWRSECFIDSPSVFNRHSDIGYENPLPQNSTHQEELQQHAHKGAQVVFIK